MDRYLSVKRRLQEKLTAKESAAAKRRRPPPTTTVDLQTDFSMRDLQVLRTTIKKGLRRQQSCMLPYNH
jgi:hypothetical protein